MADSEKDATEDSSQTDAAKDIRKAAENEIAKAMDGAFAKLPVSGEQSSVTQKHLSDDKQAVQQDAEYVKPMPDPYGKAIKYLEQHNIMQLFQVCSYQTYLIKSMFKILWEIIHLEENFDCWFHRGKKKTC